jgi:general secretion pathway protein D
LSGDRDALSRLDLSARNGRPGGPGAQAGNQPTQVVYFNDTGDARQVPPGVQAVGQGYTVNLQGVTVDVAAKSLLGDILGVPYTLDPTANGTVTMATGGPVPRSDLLMIFENALQANGLILVSEGSGFRIKALDGAGHTAALSAEGYGFTAVPLRRLGAKRMLALLDGFAAPEGAIRASENDDMILVRGSAADRANILGIVQSLDVDMLAKPNAGIAFLQNAPASQVAADLATVAANDPRASGWATQVLQRSNAILVQAHDRSDLQMAMQWIRQLDRTGGAAGGDITVYQVQYAKASDLTGILQSTFGEGGSAPPPAATPTAPADGIAVPSAGAPAVTAVAAPMGGDTRFTPDDGNNTIIIRGSTPVRQQALQLLAAIDKAPVQVLIDVLLIEVTLNDATSMGVQAYLQSHAGSLIATNGNTVAISPSAPGFNLVLGTGVNPKLIIDDLSQVTKVKVVSAPSVSAFENEEAEIKVVEQVPIVTQQVVSTTAGNAPVVNSVEYRDAGVILKVTPRVSQTNLVNLAVGQELSAVVSTGTGAATLTPTLRQRSISTRVAVYDGQTVALGGLISTQDSKGRNKLFGFLTNHASDQTGRTELIVFITPRVVRNPRDAAAAAADLRARMPQMSGQ